MPRRKCSPAITLSSFAVTALRVKVFVLRDIRILSLQLNLVVLESTAKPLVVYSYVPPEDGERVGVATGIRNVADLTFTSSCNDCKKEARAFASPGKCDFALADPVSLKHHGRMWCRAVRYGTTIGNNITPPSSG
jgi:hypothetical protein